MVSFMQSTTTIIIMIMIIRETYASEFAVYFQHGSQFAWFQIGRNPGHVEDALLPLARLKFCQRLFRGRVIDGGDPRIPLPSYLSIIIHPRFCPRLHPCPCP